MSRPGDLPALEAGPGVSEGLLGGMSIPVGTTRRAHGYDDDLECPMSSPPSGININNLWRRPLIPERKFARLAEEDESEGGVKQSATFEYTKPPVPVVKAKASSVMNSLIIKQTQESMHKFEKQAGLTDTGYTPHKGLNAEETHYHRLAESMHKLQMQSVDAKEEKQPLSGQSTPAVTPQSSPRQIRRGWFSTQGSTGSLTGSEMSTSSSSSVDLASSDGPVECWGTFGPRPQVSKSTTDPGGFALQSYKGAQKPTPMEAMKAQATRLAEDPTNFKAPPKMEIPTMEGKRPMSQPHKLKHRDMNVLTPSGF
ncbi:putative monooxygenase p33MONOX [Carassius carassius]|uniref:putative monooxygenase p33MONOX n=1 Tax=Carassius carassius TaxID=217509 RepID=UPI002868D7E0|nr:putative monooxygenase p33MONOX [Carassius carassius]XP_059382601.1 putative monooxygenase p33MONOX [Carassius carassius]XP_059382602.1 putative monooxygenase p33MONOX [Carassius carassius]XP_059382603.1 putative monooxygenase p33MONOX [Carassius carassius]